MNPLFSQPGNRGQNVMRNGNGRPQIGACLTFTEFIPFSQFFLFIAFGASKLDISLLKGCVFFTYS